ncbi:MAG TPA: EAL domain-containing protein [Spirochaetia bacterium]|nr:EAL domain-containing protein [Spirochaetia bacterium]
MLVIGPDGSIEWSNPGFLELVGKEEAGPVGNSLSAFFDDSDGAAVFLSGLRKRLAKNVVDRGEVLLRGPRAENMVCMRYQASALHEHADHSPGILGRIVLLLSGSESDAREEEVRGFSRFSEESPFPVLRVALDGTLVSANRGSWLLLSHWKTEVGGRVPAPWRKTIDKVVRQNDAREVEVRIGIKILLLVLVPVADQGYVNIFGLDVTGRKQAEKRVLLDAQVFESATEAVVITDTEQRIVDVNRAFTTITGYTREEILGENVSILSSDRQDARFYEEMWESVRLQGSWRGEIWDRRKNGEVFPKLLSISAVKDETGKVTRYIGLFSDITTIKQAQEKLSEMAHYDSLTGLPNRRYFLDRLKANLEQARRVREGVALMFVDLDGFKLVNDNLGHKAGDELLREVGNRIRRCVRESDMVARIGGDEFTVILSRIKRSDNASIVARKILEKIYEPIILEQKELFISSSIGIAVFPEDSLDMEGLLQDADTALYRAKDLGKNGYQFFSREMNTRAMERLTLQTHIRQGLANREFTAYYQPQVDAATGRLVGLEALARWNSPHIGLVSPDRFIPLAEETGLIHELGEMILREACGQGRLWRDQGMPQVRIAVNISAHQLRRPDFVPKIESAVRETGFPPELLELELTESILVDDSLPDLEKLSQIKAMGIRLTIDDFGTKYSSFAYLRRLPIDRLKIDRTFVQDLPGDLRCAEIVSAITALSRSLSIDVVAEGVETAAQAELLRDRGCLALQGYYCSRPFPPQGLGVFLERREKEQP